MEYTKLISVTGLGGLYELVASKTDGAAEEKEGSTIHDSGIVSADPHWGAKGPS